MEAINKYFWFRHKGFSRRLAWYCADLPRISFSEIMDFVDRMIIIGFLTGLLLAITAYMDGRLA